MSEPTQDGKNLEISEKAATNENLSVEERATLEKILHKVVPFRSHWEVAPAPDYPDSPRRSAKLTRSRLIARPWWLLSTSAALLPKRESEI